MRAREIPCDRNDEIVELQILDRAEELVAGQVTGFVAERIGLRHERGVRRFAGRLAHRGGRIVDRRALLAERRVHRANRFDVSGRQRESVADDEGAENVVLSLDCRSRVERRLVLNGVEDRRRGGLRQANPPAGGARTGATQTRPDRRTARTTPCTEDAAAGCRAGCRR